ncbi:MAG: acyl-CoA synthetase [Leptospiraceae bacterium]|nr:acyl-CoA synthetase [Leptospiraceae bacterium]MCP5495327.1 acyl-CoA synthetase [Leptospiraceae bacterium]
MEQFNLTQYCLHHNLKNNPNKTALTFIDNKQGKLNWTYQEIYNDISKIANQLDSYNLPKGSRIVIRLPQSPEYAILFFAIILSGLVAVPTSPQLTSEEERFIVRDTEASIFVYSDLLGKPENIPNTCQSVAKDELFSEFSTNKSEYFRKTQKEDPAFIVYTSGTTGFPKGVLHAHRNVIGRQPMQKGWTDLNSTDKLLHAGQLNWTYTFGVGLVDTWTWGATSILYNGPSEPSIWADLIESEKATIFVTVPGLYRRILKHANLKKYKFDSIRHCLTAGSSLHPELREKWNEATGKYLYEALGMSEISTYISTSPKIKYKPGSPGKPQEGRNVAILPIEEGTNPLPVGEIGLLAIHRSDPGLMLGYWNRKEEEETVFRGDWFIGGDLAHIDEEGYVFYHGRNDELMNSFGYRVSPLEVERVLNELPFISEAAVAEIPKGKDLSIIAAFIVLKESIKEEEIVKNNILDHLSQKLAKYKLPREIRFVSSLPHNQNGKLIRKKLLSL